MILEPLHLRIEPPVVSRGAPRELRVLSADTEAALPPGRYGLRITHRRGAGHSATLELDHAGGDSLRFRFGAAAAGECTVEVRFPGGQAGRAGSFYLAPESLAPLLPLRGDLHVHTWYSDGRASPTAMVAQARALGLDFVAITDHECWAGSVEAHAAAAQMGSAPIVLLGEEVSFVRGHLVAVATRGSVAEQASVREAEMGAIAGEVTARSLSTGAPRDEYARALWSARKIHELGGIAFLAHPYWVANDEYHLERSVGQQLLLDGEVDGVELLGDVDYEHNMLAVADYMGLLQQGLSTTVVGNSDTHGAGHTFGRYWTTLFTRERSEAGVLDALRNGRAVACMALGHGLPSIFGPLDLVEYAYFLHRVALPPIGGKQAPLEG